LGAFRLPVWLLESTRRVRGQLPRQGSSLHLGPGDMLLLPDGYWGKMEVWEYAAAARAAGAFTVVIVYDLIPVTHPQFVPKRTPAHFTKYLHQSVQQADLVMTISKTVRDQLEAELPRLFPDVTHPPALDYFHLGADFVAREGAVREDVLRAFEPQAGATPYITVSTFDPRKNHGFTLDAFERLWERGSEARLVYIGGRGWMCGDLLARLEQHPRRGKNVFVFHGLSDCDLNYCYQRARGTISASAVEGFGLPIIESLWHGRRTFASDTPIHREVGGAHAEYFSLASPAALAERIEAWERAIAQGESVQRPAVKPMDWRESTQTLLARCLAAFAHHQADAAGARPRTHERKSFPKVA
jgi:alpha-1,2-rhamnosyltransferase